MTPEEKAKRYDLAIEAARKLRGIMEEGGNFGGIEDLEVIFPELAESEDERMIKAITEGIRDVVEVFGWSDFGDILIEDILAWLKKQGEKTSDKIVEKARTEKQRVLLTETDGNANIDWDCRSLNDVKILLKCGLEFIRTIEANKQILTDNRFGGCSFRVSTRYDKDIKQGEQKPTDNVDPKFKVGDWIVGGNAIYQVTALNNELQCYIAVSINNETVKIPYYFDCGQNHMCSYHLWTIQDAKDGDVLAYENGWTCIFKCLNDNLFSSHCFMDRKGWFCEIGGRAHTLDKRICGEIYPATKEQRDKLLNAMADAGYTFDFEKKGLKKIEQPKLTAFEKAIKDMMAEYRYAIDNTDAITEEEVKNYSEYLLSLIPQKPAEWTEEDKNMFGSIRSTLSMYMNNLSLPKEIRDIHKEELKWFDELYNRGLDV